MIFFMKVIGCDVIDKKNNNEIVDCILATNEEYESRKTIRGSSSRFPHVVCIIMYKQRQWNVNMYLAPKPCLFFP